MNFPLDIQARVAELERKKETLRRRAAELKPNDRNEAYRKINLIDDEIARILTPNQLLG
ncbi:MAG: hypothetical protein ACYCO4_04255 [Sulfobacillus sp.]